MTVPSLYFCATKLEVWSNVADRVTEASRMTRSVVSRYFDTHRRDVVSQLVGMIQCSFHNINDDNNNSNNNNNSIEIRECKPGGYFSNPGLRVWRPSNPGTRV